MHAVEALPIASPLKNFWVPPRIIKHKNIVYHQVWDITQACIPTSSSSVKNGLQIIQHITTKF